MSTSTALPDPWRRTCCGSLGASCSTTSMGTVDRALMPYACEITDTADDDVPTWSWGSAVLSTMYRGLCDACSMTNENVVLTGCPLLLQLWAYVRFAVGWPIIDHKPYERPL